MKRVVSILVIAAFLAAPMLVAAQQAKKASTKKAETVTVVGMVDEVKNKKGQVTGYTLTTDTDTYSVAKGKKIAAMVGKKVEATGTVATAKGGKKTLTVKQVKEVM